MSKGQRYQPKAKFFGSALASMRETAFGMAQRVQVFTTLDRSEKMRDDDAMIAAAEAKRQRKAAKRAQQ